MKLILRLFVVLDLAFVSVGAARTQDPLATAARRAGLEPGSPARLVELARAFYGDGWRAGAFAAAQEALRAQQDQDADVAAYVASERLLALSRLGLVEPMLREYEQQPAAVRTLLLAGAGALDRRLGKIRLRAQRADLRLDLAAAYTLVGQLDTARIVAGSSLSPPTREGDEGDGDRRERLALRRELLERALTVGDGTDPFDLLSRLQHRTEGGRIDVPFDTTVHGLLAARLAEREGYPAFARAFLYAIWYDLHYTTPDVDALMAREGTREPFQSIARQEMLLRPARHRFVGELEAGIDRLRGTWAVMPPEYATGGPRRPREPAPLVPPARLEIEPSAASAAARAAFVAGFTAADFFGEEGEVFVSGPTLPWSALELPGRLVLVPEPKPESERTAPLSRPPSWVVRLFALNRAEDRAMLVWSAPEMELRGRLDLVIESTGWRVDRSSMWGDGVLESSRLALDRGPGETRQGTPGDSREAYW